LNHEDVTFIEARPYDPDNLRRALELSRLCFELSGSRRQRPGVYKYRSIEEANEGRAQRELSAAAAR
jgi:hypothetical protein